MRTFVVLFWSSYFVSTMIAWFSFVRDDDRNLKNESSAFRILVYFLLYCPGFSQTVIFAFILVGSIISTKDIIDKKLKIRKQKNKILKERNIKIKLGIIKINKDDPYGEEDWTE